MKEEEEWMAECNGILVIIYVGLNIALSSFAIFLPTIIRDMGFSSLHAQLLSIPPYVVACCLVFVCCCPCRFTLFL